MRILLWSALGGIIILLGCASESTISETATTNASPVTSEPPTTAAPTITTAAAASVPSTTAPITTDLAPTTTAAPTSSTTSIAPTTTVAAAPDAEDLVVVSFPVPEGSHPHDVAPGGDGGVWYTAQATGELGWLDPTTGETRHVDLGAGSGPHGVVVDESGLPWVTLQAADAIASVDPDSGEVTTYEIPTPGTGPHTPVFDQQGRLWFTGSGGFVGRLDPESGEMEVFEAPGGGGPYGITVTPQGDVYYASLQNSYLGAISEDGSVKVLKPPTPQQGARRVWSDSHGAVWVSEWNSGNLSRYDPASEAWSTYPLPEQDSQTYAVYVDEHDMVWVSDFGSNSLLRFDPTTEEFHSFELPHDPGDVRQILGRPGEVWGAESAADHLVVIRE